MMQKMLQKQHLIIHIMSVILILAFATIVISALTPYGAATTPDSLHYLDIARNIKQGHGIAPIQEWSATPRGLAKKDP